MVTLVTICEIVKKVNNLVAKQPIVIQAKICNYFLAKFEILPIGGLLTHYSVLVIYPYVFVTVRR